MKVIGLHKNTSFIRHWGKWYSWDGNKLTRIMFEDLKPFWDVAMGSLMEADRDEKNKSKHSDNLLRDDFLDEPTHSSKSITKIKLSRSAPVKAKRK